MKSKDRTAMLVMLALLPLVLVALCYSRLPGQVSLPWSGQETGGKAGLWLWAALGPLLALLSGLVWGKLRRPFETAALVLLYVLPSFMGMDGILWAMVAAEVLTIAGALPYTLHMRKAG